MSSAFTVLAADWFGVSHPASPRFTLRLEAGVITLAATADKPALLVPGDTGGYAEGLWEGDCAELFLVNPANGFYAEFNLSPQGGRWCCAFTAPRVRAAGAPAAFAGVSAAGVVSPASWSAQLRIPVAALPAELDFDPAVTRGNVTFCLGADPQRYFTLADLGGGNPDFHRPARWIPLFA